MTHSASYTTLTDAATFSPGEMHVRGLERLSAAGVELNTPRA
jgi:hypothetical protein